MPEKTKGQFLMNESTTRLQYGALCWRVYNSRVQVLLVTSRETGRWIIPKGWPMEGLCPEAAAAREAWEEAGVVGTPLAESIGSYHYAKILGPERSIPCLVQVFPLKVKRLREKYPESRQRRRKWFLPEKAAKKIDELDLQVLVAGFRPIGVPQDAGAVSSALPPIVAD